MGNNSEYGTEKSIMGLVVYFAMIYAFFYIASKGWQRGK